jgi:hypothetical protein
MSQKVIGLLKKYPEMIQERSLLAGQIKGFQGCTGQEVIEAMNFHTPDGEHVQNSLNTGRIEDIALEYEERLLRINREWLWHLTCQHQELNQEIHFLESALRALPQEQADLMWDLVVNQMTWDQMEAKYRYTRAGISYIRRKAIQTLDRMYFKRDVDTAAYLLS